MPVKKDPSGQRSVAAEAEVPGTPEEVWAAIATGPGISCWFVPSALEERVGGVATSDFGPGMESKATITEWNPPSRFALESHDGGPGPVATEWVVEAKGQGACVVRVTHRWFASTDDWDRQFEGHTYGWQAFFRILKLYLERFSGQPGVPLQFAAFSGKPSPDIWSLLMSSLAIPEAGQPVAPAPSAPPLAGQVERREDGEHRELMLSLEQPAPGIAHIFLMPMGPQVMASIRLYLYGDQGAAAATETERAWTRWLAERFPQNV